MLRHVAQRTIIDRIQDFFAASYFLEDIRGAQLKESFPARIENGACYGLSILQGISILNGDEKNFLEEVDSLLHFEEVLGASKIGPHLPCSDPKASFPEKTWSRIRGLIDSILFLHTNRLGLFEKKNQRELLPEKVSILFGDKSPSISEDHMGIFTRESLHEALNLLLLPNTFVILSVFGHTIGIVSKENASGSQSYYMVDPNTFFKIREEKGLSYYKSDQKEKVFTSLFRHIETGARSKVDPSGLPLYFPSIITVCHHKVSPDALNKLLATSIDRVGGQVLPPYNSAYSIPYLARYFNTIAHVKPEKLMAFLEDPEVFKHCPDLKGLLLGHTHFRNFRKFLITCDSFFESLTIEDMLPCAKTSDPDFLALALNSISLEGVDVVEFIQSLEKELSYHALLKAANQCPSIVAALFKGADSAEGLCPFVKLAQIADSYSNFQLEEIYSQRPVALHPKQLAALHKANPWVDKAPKDFLPRRALRPMIRVTAQEDLELHSPPNMHFTS